MLPLRNRLRGPHDFDRIFRDRNKRSVGSKDSVVFFIPNGRAESRFGIVISRKFGKAARRSRRKRLYREAIRHNLTLIKPGFDIVFMVRKSAAEMDLWRLEKMILAALQKAKLIKTQTHGQGLAGKNLGVAQAVRPAAHQRI